MIEKPKRVKTTKKKQVYKIFPNSGDDWCHVCGRRQTDIPMVDYFHPDPTSLKECYVRLCATCLILGLTAMLQGKEMEAEYTEVKEATK